MTAAATTNARIEVLPSLVADQIAAGEVVERPASVVKELVENALDAGAADVFVQLEAGGRDRILVRDDGSGMSAEDASRACLRHATSKLRHIEDLTAIGTLGFRGEALASIAAVARVEIQTRLRGAQEGIRIVVSEGRAEEPVPAGLPEGTTIEVTGLFDAVPARRKFLRTPQTELGHVVEWLNRMALLHPGVGFQLQHASRTVLRHPAVKEPRERLRQVLGAERAGEMVEVQWSEEDFSVRGFTSRAGVSFAQARQIHCFVRGRFVRDRVLLRALQDAYRALLPQGRHPAAVLFVDLPGEAVDVNVHPAKTEVRFADADRVFGVVLRAVRAAIAGPGLKTVPADMDRGERARPSGGDSARATSGRSTADAGAPGRERVAEAMQRYVLRTGGRESGFAPPKERSTRDLPLGRSAGTSGGAPGPGRGVATDVGVRAPVERGLPAGDPAPGGRVGAEEQRSPSAGSGLPGNFAELQVLGQALNGYIVCAYPDGLVLIDQHAAHERVRFERLRAAEVDAPASQRLLVPVVVEPDDLARTRLLEEREALVAAGFDIEEFGEKSLVVRAIPATLDVSTNADSLLEEVAGDLAEVGVSERLASARDALHARVACHGAVRVGDPLTTEEMQRLVADLDTIPFASTCPHGRPLLIQLERREIERRVGRT